MAGSTWTYLAADLLTGEILAELPLRYVNFSSKLDDIGTFTGQLLASDPLAQKIQAFQIIQPGRTALYVDLNGTLVWGGVLTTMTYNVGTRLGMDFVITIQGKEFLYYFSQRLLLQALPFNGVSTDQLVVAQQLVSYAQSLTGGNIGVQVQGGQLSGVDVVQTWLPTDAKTIFDCLQTLQQTDDGFDMAIDVGYGIGGAAPGTPGKVLTLSYPRRGRTAPETQLVMEFPGNVTEYQWSSDATQMANSIYDVGPGSGASMLVSQASDPGPLNSGWPLYEASYSYKDTSVTQSFLDAHARADLTAYEWGAVLPQIVVESYMDPVFGSYVTGDEIRLRITSHQFNSGYDQSGMPMGPGLDQNFRITAWTATPQDQGMHEQIQLTLGPPLA